MSMSNPAPTTMVNVENNIRTICPKKRTNTGKTTSDPICWASLGFETLDEINTMTTEDNRPAVGVRNTSIKIKLIFIM